jgi:hypothetical protein
MVELETLAIVAFTGILTLVEIHRVVHAHRDEKLDRVQKKIELAFTVSAWSWNGIVQGVKATSSGPRRCSRS